LSDLCYDFFYKEDKTTWFLDYSVIEPGINVENITEHNYENPPMNKIKNNQVKKVLHAKEIQYIEHGATRYDEESYERQIVSANELPGEHIVIGNEDNAVFTLDPVFITNMVDNPNITRPEQNLIPQTIKELHFKVVKAFLDRQLIFTSQKVNHRFFVENIEYRSPQTETLYIPYDNNHNNIHDTISLLLTQLQNNTDRLYATTNQVTIYNNFPFKIALEQRIARKKDFEKIKKTKNKIDSDKANIKKAEEYERNAHSNALNASRAGTNAKKAYDSGKRNDFYINVLESRKLANAIQTQLDGIRKIRKIQFAKKEDNDTVDKLYGEIIAKKEHANEKATYAEEIDAHLLEQIRQREVQERDRLQAEREPNVSVGTSSFGTSLFGTSSFGTPQHKSSKLGATSHVLGFTHRDAAPAAAATVRPVAPAAAATVRPVVPAAAATVRPVAPAAAAAVRPVVPATVHPVAPATVHPVAPATVHPVVPATVHPVVPATVHPVAPATVHPVAPAAAPSTVSSFGSSSRVDRNDFGASRTADAPPGFDDDEDEHPRMAADAPPGFDDDKDMVTVRKRKTEETDANKAKKQKTQLKYLKYKQKYLELKNKINQLNN
jgi:hypothetical protein